MSINSILNIATQGLAASQSGIRSTTQNVANVNTPGYVRLEHQQNARAIAGQSQGVEVGALRRAADRFLAAASLHAGGSAAVSAERARYLDMAQAAFGDPTGSSSLFARIDSTLSSFESAVASAGSLSARRASIGELSGLLSRLNQAGQEIASARLDADQRVGTTVERINTLLQDIAQANATIARAQASTGDSTGPIQRQADMIAELSGLIDIRVLPRPDGTNEIRMRDGTLLAGLEAGRLTHTPADPALGQFNRVTLTFGSASTPRAIEPNLQGGALRGLIDVRDRDLADIAEGLGELAGRLADAFNAVHNQNATLPALRSAQGRDTGLLAGDALGFTGATTIAVVGANGTLGRRIDVDFTAGTISVNGAVVGATGGTVGAFTANLNAALGGFGTASFAGGRLTLTAAQTAPGATDNGLIFDQPDTGASRRGEMGFAHFFGMNDLVSLGPPSTAASGLRGTDAHGFPVGAQIGMRLMGPAGEVFLDRSVTVPPGDINALVAALNDPVSGMGSLGAFALTADGQMRWTPAPGREDLRLSLTNDVGPRGDTGRSFGALFGVSQSARTARATSLEVAPAIAADPRRLGFARPDLTGVAVGQIALGMGDSRGAQALFDVSRTRFDFQSVQGLSQRSLTLGDYVASLGGEVGARAGVAEADRDSAAALKVEADERRSNVEGVNLDEELVKLTSFQQAFSAAARMIRAADEMYQALLSAV